MVAHQTVGSGAATARARVAALLADAGLVGAAVLVDDALGSTVGRPVDEARQARADGSVGGHVALGVGAARVRSARVHRQGRSHWRRKVRA